MAEGNTEKGKGKCFARGATRGSPCCGAEGTAHGVCEFPRCSATGKCHGYKPRIGDLPVPLT
eukprot:5254292-Prorocentrum_lima.AAC.1